MATQSSNMIYPSMNGTASVETIFVEGYRFDICEVADFNYEFLCPNSNGHSKKPSGRYFLVIEESVILNFSFAKEYHSKTGECRWDFFCGAKSDMKSYVKDFEALISECQSIHEKIAKKPIMATMVQPKLDAKKKHIYQRFGIRWTPA